MMLTTRSIASSRASRARRSDPRFDRRGSTLTTRRFAGRSGMSTQQLKSIAKESIPRALEKAERYRLLNEPFLAESICLDILAVDPENGKALVCYVLALTDQ